MENIVRTPKKDQYDDDGVCSLCRDDNTVAVIQGSTNCSYCGNQINLCSQCFGKMMKDIEALKISWRIG